MYDLYPYFTGDGTIGLFSPGNNDIYHSVYGAYTEACEKFILPADLKNFFAKNYEVKVLDICFGIGYNTKSFLNSFINFIYNDKIGGNNILKYNDEIYTNNKKYKIFIHAIDKDKNLAYLSPYFVTDKKNIKNQTINFSNKKIIRMIPKKVSAKYKLNKEVNILLFEKIKNLPDYFFNCTLESKKYKEYFDPFMKSLFKTYKIYKNHNLQYNNYDFHKFFKFTSYLFQSDCLIAFLHNIYYHHVSKCYKKAMKCLKLFDFYFKLSIDDARNIIKHDTNVYNFIFLDAFTPAKCPNLWTVDFFKLLFERLDDDGMILTYSNSAAVRNGFIKAGFFIGKNLCNGKANGTIAVKNKSLIKFELSEFDLGLLKTRAGIIYRDENLNATNAAIIAAHKFEVDNSDLEASSQFIKRFSKN